MTPERKVITPVLNWAMRNNVIALKYDPRGCVGWPDYIFILPLKGTHVWIEFKAPGKKPTPLQQHRIGQLKEQGALAYWTDDSDRAIHILKSALNETTLEA